MTNKAINDLMSMLRTMRPAYSAEERRFIARWIKPLGTYADGAGNEILQIGDAPVLWSCHTDTVHRKEGVQRIERCGDLIRLSKKEQRATCLGADCTTGVWLMREMILAQVPGLYVFHRGEEIGGDGSRHIAFKTPKLLENILFAIAFDRKGKDNIITYQSWMRCASDNFAHSIASQLPGSYFPDDSGIFTDTANYTDLVPECTNLSVGYSGEHTRFETQSISHALALREALLKIDSNQFWCERDPSVIDDLWARPLKKEKSTSIDPWDDFDEEFEYEGVVWVKRNGQWFELEELDDYEDDDRDGPHTYPAYCYKDEEEEDPLMFGDWSPNKHKW